MVSTLGEFIKERLVELDMNQSQLAKKVGVGSGQITMWISGTRPTKHIEALADALECTEGELVELLGPAPKKGPQLGHGGKPGGGRKRSPDWQFEIRDSYDLTLPEEKPSNGNGSKATITPPITPITKPNGRGGILRAKISILESVSEIRGMLKVGRLVGDERTIELTNLVEEKIGNIETEARGLED